MCGGEERYWRQTCTFIFRLIFLMAARLATKKKKSERTEKIFEPPPLRFSRVASRKNTPTVVQSCDKSKFSFLQHVHYDWLEARELLMRT